MFYFDEILTKYTLAGFVLVLLFCIFFIKACIRNKSNQNFNLWLWGGTFLILLIYMRLPFLTYNQELDIDESQMLAQALSLKKHWIYWKYVDGTTQGPLTVYFLILPSLFGMPFDYVTARIVGFVVLLAVLLLTYGTFHNFFSRKISLIIFTPIGLFYILSQGYFSALYNEYLVLLLLAIGFWQFSILYKQVKPSGWQLFLIGFVSGMVPFAKLQGVPTALVTVIFTLFLVFLRSNQKIKDFVTLVLSGLFFPALVFSVTLYSGVFDYFWKFYLIGNFQYSGGGTIWSKLLGFVKLIRFSGQFMALFFSYGLLVFATVIILIRTKTLGKTISLLFLFSGFHIVFAIYSVTKSGYYFQHYVQFLIIPMGLFAGVLLELGLREVTWTSSKIYMSSLVWLSICILPHFIYKLLTVTGFTPKTSKSISINDLNKPLQISEVSKEIKKYALPGEDVTIWGWKPAYHLETNTSQGTADVMIYRLMTTSNTQKDYYVKYLNDLKRNKPVVFVDEVTTNTNWFNDPEKFCHENFPEVCNYIWQFYTHVSTINGEKIYVRKDRILK